MISRYAIAIILFRFITAFVLFIPIIVCVTKCDINLNIRYGLAGAGLSMFISAIVFTSLSLCDHDLIKKYSVRYTLISGVILCVIAIIIGIVLYIYLSESTGSWIFGIGLAELVDSIVSAPLIKLYHTRTMVSNINRPVA